MGKNIGHSGLSSFITETSQGEWKLLVQTSDQHLVTRIKGTFSVLISLWDSMYPKTNQSLDFAQDQKYRAPSENRSHYCVVAQRLIYLS